MNLRADDLVMLNELINEHPGELTDVETEAFAGMRFDLTAYVGVSGARGPGFHQLTDKQRAWVKGVHQRLVPDYQNLVSSGICPRGTPTAESKALDAMLAGPKVMRPPPRKRSDEE